MTTYVLSNSSPGAPPLSSTPGALIPVLDFLLVTSMGWTKEYTSSTTGAVYRAPTGNRFYYQFTHTGVFGSSGVSGVTAEMRVFETMSAYNTGTGGSTADSTDISLHTTSSSAIERPYSFYSDGTLCYFFVNRVDGYAMYVFGDIVSYKPGDAYASVVGGCSVNSSALTQTIGVDNSTAGVAYRRLVRAVNQTSGNQAACFTTNYCLETSLGAGASTVPSIAAGGMMLLPLIVCEPSGVRGILPGIMSPVTPGALAVSDTFAGTGDLAGRTYVVQLLGATNRVCVETSDTWRA